MRQHHEIEFADAVRPTIVYVLGLQLKTYSIGHDLLLASARNPFLILSPAEFNSLPDGDQRDALRRAVLICYRTWSENQIPEKWLRLWAWRQRNIDWPLAIAEFWNYLAAGRAFPTAPTKEADEIANGDPDYSGRQLGAPLTAQLYQFAVTTMRLAPEAAWDAGFAETNWIYLTHLEAEGNYKIENRKEAEIREEMVEHRAEFSAEKQKEREKRPPREA